MAERAETLASVKFELLGLTIDALWSWLTD